MLSTETDTHALTGVEKQGLDQKSLVKNVKKRWTVCGDDCSGTKSPNCWGRTYRLRQRSINDETQRLTIALKSPFLLDGNLNAFERTWLVF